MYFPFPFSWFLLFLLHPKKCQAYVMCQWLSLSFFHLLVKGKPSLTVSGLPVTMGERVLSLVRLV